MPGRDTCDRRFEGRWELGSFAGETDRRNGSQTLGRNGVVAAMPVTAARDALFRDVRQFAARRDLAIPAYDAAAGERCVPYEPDETHNALIVNVAKEQLPCR